MLQIECINTSVKKNKIKYPFATNKTIRQMREGCLVSFELRTQCKQSYPSPNERKTSFVISNLMNVKDVENKKGKDMLRSSYGTEYR